MSNNVDLSQLAVDRSEAPKPKKTGRRRGWLSRYILPLFILFAFASLLGWAAKDSVLPSHAVTVVPVVVARAEVQQADTPLFQAAGWIEPSPIATVVSSLAAGVLEELNVVAGQRVRKGEVIARLIDTDARLALAEARTELRLREAERVAAQAELHSAKTSLEKPIQLQADLAAADSALAQVEAQLNSLPPAMEAARAKRILAAENMMKKERSGNAIAGRVLREAKAEQVDIVATLEALEARQPALERQRKALARRRNALAEKLDLKLEERRRVAIAQASLQAAEARRDREQLAVETAQLRLERMTVLSSIDGRVLAIHASPGKRVNGLDPHSVQGSSAVATLYDPQSVQVRVDVRLEDVSQVQLGQKARIETASASDVLHGEVISITSVADIQKNTLQVKVAITDPPEVIRPEMLAQVTFLAVEQPGKQADESEDRLRILVPRQLISSGEGAAHVWLADRATKTARRQAVSLGRAGTEALVEVVSGLTPTDKLISGGQEGLQDGSRIRITAEDTMLGIVATTPRTADRPDTTQIRK